MAASCFSLSDLEFVKSMDKNDVKKSKSLFIK